MKNTRLLLVDDHQMIRDGIKSYLSEEPSIELIGEAANGADAVLMAERLKPDVILMDISMPQLNGMEAAKLILEKLPNTKIIMLSMYEDEKYVTSCLAEGVHGYIHKGADKHEIIFGIKEVMEGEQYLSKPIREVLASSYIKSLRQKKEDLKRPVITLTKREKEIVKHLIDGLTSADIGDKLFISARTVDTHRANIMHKLEVKNVVELLNKVNKEGLID
jgi:DNA-binding NarL/FixJ family response regulator